MAKDTKERILALALDKFSQNGYDGTNIRELTSSLGLVKSALYRHFDSKEAIWNALLDEMMADFTIHDEKVVKTRKLLSIEQFRDERARDLATKHFLTGLTAMFTPLFQGMMDKGLLLRDDPAMLAFAYTAPISALIHLCDREPERTDEAIRRIEAFSRHFIRTYACQGGNTDETI